MTTGWATSWARRRWPSPIGCWPGSETPAGIGPSGAAAVVALAGTPGLSVTELGRGVGLSQPAAARMVDALEKAGSGRPLPRRRTGGRGDADRGRRARGRRDPGRAGHRADPARRPARPRRARHADDPAGTAAHRALRPAAPTSSAGSATASAAPTPPSARWARPSATAGPEPWVRPSRWSRRWPTASPTCSAGWPRDGSDRCSSRLLGQLSGLVAVGFAALLLTPQAPAAADLAWGAVSGVGTGLAMVFLFRGMARGAMSIVVPVSAVGGVVLPVLVGVAFLGERPSWITWAGVVLVLPALWLVSRGPATATATGPALRDGLLSGVGIAVQYLGLAQAGPAAGLWPVVAGRVTAVVAVAALAATALSALLHPRLRPAVPAVVAGVLARRRADRLPAGRPHRVRERRGGALVALSGGAGRGRTAPAGRAGPAPAGRRPRRSTRGRGTRRGGLRVLRPDPGRVLNPDRQRRA